MGVGINKAGGDNKIISLYDLCIRRGDFPADLFNFLSADKQIPFLRIFSCSVADETSFDQKLFHFFASFTKASRTCAI